MQEVKLWVCGCVSSGFDALYASVALHYLMEGRCNLQGVGGTKY